MNIKKLIWNEINYNWKLLCYSGPEVYFLWVYCKVNIEFILSVSILNQPTALLYEIPYKVMAWVESIGSDIS